MQVNFIHQHVRDIVVILEGGNLPHPQCPRCDMLVPRHALNMRHLATDQCARRAERKRRRMADEELREISERDFQAYGKHLENAAALKYLGRAMPAGDDDWPSVAGNLQNASKSWGWMLRILSW